MITLNIRNAFMLIYSVALFLSCSQNLDSDKVNWNSVDKIIEQIKVPEFIDQTFNILDFGSKADSSFDSRSFIQDAINRCSESGGGRVLVPSGTYYCGGPIILQSNVNLHFEDGVIINFSTTPSDYLPLVLSRWEGVECFNYSALIYAKDEHNLSITGKGILNGNATEDNWWPWKGKIEYGWSKGMPSQADSLGRPFLFKLNHADVDVSKRLFGAGSYLRPNFIQFINCKNILIENITLRDSPMWFIHPVLSENITIRGVKVVGKGPNNDGCNPESCKNVLIENCYFDTGDDCIAIKSGRNNDGRRINVPSENIVIRNCVMRDGHGGVVIGSEISGGCKNVFAENCVMDSPNLDRVLRIKTNSIRGGNVENIFVRNIEVGEVREAIVKINLNYDPKEFGPKIYMPKIKNIYVSKIKSKKSKYAFYLEGLENSKIENVFIEDSEFEGVESGSIIKNVVNFKPKQVLINNQEFN